ncbi:uncharacterized protein LOC113749274 [Coffea eugenioides]|uniref:uncharacterized protein LOC113749274 n=1 Tax=Coffea eugenioides TaxID=49369 RepID=UPI000F6133F9|nr:uncharacterized protein LOC113749274 [Coffea eugenioides]
MGRPLTVSQIEEVNRLHFPEIIFLSETKNKKCYMNKLKMKLKFDSLFVVDPIGRSGGLAVMWRKDVQIKRVLYTDFTIELCIEDLSRKISWWLVCIYANVDDAIREKQWKIIESRRALWGNRWLLAGDMNDILSNDEKWGGLLRPERSFKQFRDFIRTNELIDIGFEGKPWTWSNNWDKEGEVKERLDRMLGSRAWRRKFEKAKCCHIHNEASDHCMLLLHTEPSGRKWRRRFYFDRRWLQYQEVNGVVKKAWEREQVGSRFYQLKNRIKECRVALLSWNRSLKSNARNDIDKIKKEIKELRESEVQDRKQRICELKRLLAEAYRQEELFWGQKARVNWLREGDKNTSFFHAVVAGRRKRNTITTLQKEGGGWCDSEEEVLGEITGYFGNLFTSSNPEASTSIFQCIPQVITDHMNSQLIRPITELEVKKAVFSLHPNKAPGPDGMSSVFFQKFWHIVKKDVIAAISSFFHSGNLLKAINETCITLIPKIDVPTLVSHFRPISLCNVIYRVISKILVNRVKPFLNCCVSSNQSAFIPGRHIIDNIMIVHEFIHCLNNRRGGSNAFMALKLDMAKAYDRVEWGFLEKIMAKMGFCSTWISWILKCISSVSYSFNINGEKRGLVRPYRGLRQGDPLSPYLFLLVSEGLSRLLNTAMREHRISGLKIAPASPALSHLLFADDTLIFCRATKEEAGRVRQLLEIYGKASGQYINIEKSSVFFSKNTEASCIGEVLDELGGMKHVRQSKYLGLPILIGRSKAQVFSYIRDRVNNRIQGWKEKLLSQAGKEVLLKAVAMAMPNYAMNCCRLPIGLCKDISRDMAKFWWGSKEDEKRIHWMGWQKLTEVKGKGGLGFRDLQEFNKAMLAKQLWRVITKPNLLVSKVLRGKYFKGESIWKMKNRNSDSWMWKSMVSARGILERGARKRIGDGGTVNIWKDRWLLDRGYGKVTTVRPPECQIQMVQELIQNGEWNKAVVHEIFNAEDCKRILATPLSLYGGKDKLIWPYSKNGEYSVRSGYMVAKEMQQEGAGVVVQQGRSSRNEQGTEVWKFLWSLNMKYKLKHFIWKGLHNILPVNEVIKRRVGKGSELCACCGEQPETLEHMFFFCKHAELIWKASPMQWDGLVEFRKSFWLWWNSLMEARERDAGKEHICLTVNLLWQIWKSRNRVQFNSEEGCPGKVVMKAVQEWNEYEAAQRMDREDEVEKRNQQKASTEWLPPTMGVVKLNVDAALSTANGRVGWGVVARQTDGGILGAWAGSGDRHTEAMVEEATAIRTALIKARTMGWRRIEVQSDCKGVVDGIRTGCRKEPKVGAIIEDVLKLGSQFDTCSFSFIKREGNRVGHHLAKFAIQVTSDIEWEESFPVWLVNLAKQDVRAVAQTM